MADSGLFIGFGAPIRGRERQAIKVFNETFEYYSRLQQEGEIESFEPVILEPHGGELGGFFLLRGDQDKLARIRGSEEFERRTGHKATGKVTGLTPMITEWLAGGFRNYDTNETNANPTSR